MQEQIVSYSILKLAIEKGFAHPTKNVLTEVTEHYVDPRGNKTDETYSVVKKVEEKIAITQSLLQKWLRDNHKINILISQEERTEMWYIEIIHNFKRIRLNIGDNISDYEFKSFEEALEKGLQEALKLI